jgi:GNAT superfamily N-acetyltransferase
VTSAAERWVASGVAITELPRAAARVRAKLREVGPGYTGFLVLQRLLPRSVRVHPVVLTARRAGADARRERTGIRWGTPADLARLPVGPEHLRPYAERLDAGERLCVLEDGDRLLAFAWYRLGPYVHEEFGLRVAVGPREAWGSDAFVARDGRGRGTGPRLLRAGACLVAEAGHDVILALIDRPNRNMVRVQRAPGVVRVADLVVFRVGPLTLARERREGRARWRATRGALPLSAGVRP